VHVYVCAVGVDTGYAIYMRFFAEEESRTAFVAHFAGFVGGQSTFLPIRFLIL